MKKSIICGGAIFIGYFMACAYTSVPELIGVLMIGQGAYWWGQEW